MFGTYIRKNELLLYPFLEYYVDKDAEYEPAELGYGDENDYRGRFRGGEALLFVGYGLTDWLILELESALYTKETLHKSDADSSHMPEQLTESGFGDTQIQFDLRWSNETATRPEIFSYFEVTFPFQRDKVLIGTSGWEFKLGTGLIKGFRFGTLGVRAALEYVVEEEEVKLGEYAIEYLKRISPTVRIYCGIEGEDDEIELITELQLFLNRKIFLKINNAFGITSKATDWAPELGIAFSFSRYND